MLKLITHLRRKYCKHDFDVIDLKCSKFKPMVDYDWFEYHMTIRCKKCGLEVEKTERVSR